MTSGSRFRLVAATAAMLFAAAYSNSLRNGFHFDDVHVLETNLFIRDLANVPRFFTDASTFTSLPQNAVYRPLVSLSLAIDWAIGGRNPTPYHVTQLLLFAALGVLLVLLYRGLFDSTGAAPAPWHRWVALFAATLYCVHTGNTQTGNYISARSELLSALGVVGSFIVYLYVPRSRRFHLFLLPAVAGLFAKNHAVMFAPLLLAYKLLIEQQLSFAETFSRGAWPRTKSALLSSAPAFLVLGALVVFVESMAAAAQSYGGGGRLPYLATEAWVWVRYVSLYFVPIGLSADTDLHVFPTFDPRTLAGAVLLVASLAAAWYASRSRELRPVAFGILWFWIAIAPTSTVFPLAEVTNDHRMFIGFIGLNLAVVWTVATLIRRAGATPERMRTLTIAAVVTGALLLAVHVVSTFQRNKVWRDDETLWADVARKSPRNGRGLMNYGLSQMRRGRLVEARDLFLRAKQLNPYYSFLEANLGIVYNALGDPVTAEQHFKQAAALDPLQPVVHRHYGYWLLNQGRGPEGMSHLQVLNVVAPADADARRALMGLYAAIGADSALRRLANETYSLVRFDTVARDYAAGRLPFAPATPDGKGWFDLGWSFTQAGRHVDAAQVYRAAIAADPRNADAWNNLGWTLGKLGFYDAAVPPLEKAVALRPTYQLAKNNLAWVRGEAAKSRPR